MMFMNVSQNNNLELSFMKEMLDVLAMGMDSNSLCEYVKFAAYRVLVQPGKISCFSTQLS